MKLRWLAVLLLACFALCGCPCYSLYPLYTEQDAVAEPALEGTWMGTDTDEKGEITFCKSKDGGYEFSVFDPSTKIKGSYDAKLVRLGGELFMDVQNEEETVDGVNIDQPIGMLPMHAIIKVKISKDDLAIAGMEDDAIKKPNASGASQLKHELVNRGLFQVLLITADTGDLRRWVAAHAEDGFGEFGHLKRAAKAAN
jgi:hypothetical protein